MRHMKTLGFIILPALAVTLFGCSNSSTDDATATQPTVTATGFTGLFDNEDPNDAGCSTDAATLPGSSPIKDIQGQTIGNLTLRASATCKAAWGSVSVTQPGTVVTITMLSDNGRKSAFTVVTTTKVQAFGNMLSANSIHPVMATAAVPGGPEAQTDSYSG